MLKDIGIFLKQILDFFFVLLGLLRLYKKDTSSSKDYNDNNNYNYNNNINNNINNNN